MTSSEYISYSPSVIFKDDVGGAGGTDYIAVNMNGLRDDLATYVEAHINGGNRHASNDILDYYTDNVPTTRINLLETTAYENAAPDAAHLYTQWQRNDMFAKIDKDIIGGAGSTLTQRITDYFTTLTSGNGSLTTIWNLLHGGSPTFGSIIAVANDNTHAAVQGLAPIGDPASGYLARWSNHAGSVDHAYIDYSGLIVGFGGVAGVAPDTTNPGLRALSIDNTSGRKVISLRYNNNTENGYFTNDGSAHLTTGNFSGAVALGSTVAVTGAATFDSYLQGVATTDPGTGSAGNGYIWFDSGAGIWKARQGAGAAVALVGAAAAVGATGGVQYSTGGGVFGADPNNLFYDATNHRLSIGRGGTAPTYALEAAGVIAAFGGTAGLISFSRDTNPAAYLQWYRKDASVRLNTDQGDIWVIDPTLGFLTPFPWISATPANSWSNAAGHPTLAYKKDVTGSVRLRGGVLGTSASSAIIYTLPAGYIPAATNAFSCSYYSGSAWSTCTVYVNNSGQVTATIGNGVSGAIVSVNDIEFDTL